MARAYRFPRCLCQFLAVPIAENKCVQADPGSTIWPRCQLGRKARDCSSRMTDYADPKGLSLAQELERGRAP